MIQSELLESLDAPAHINKVYFKAEDISECLYTIRDDSVRPRHFLGVDNKNEIEVILSDREGYSLHEFIDGNEPLQPIIDFNLPREVHNGIEPKLMRKEILDTLNRAFKDVCLEIFPK